MKKLRKCFETPKRTIITIACMVAILVVLGAGTVVAAGVVAEGSSIGAENAKNFAFADAGIDPVSARAVKAEFDFEQGQFVYEVEFLADGSEYEYWIKASDGSVVKKNIEIVMQNGSNATVTAKITMDAAKETALADAGLTAADVTFTKEKLDLEDGISVYDIEFVAGNTEYEYEINANTGAVYSRSKETFPVNTDPTGTGQGGVHGSGQESSNQQEGDPSQNSHQTGGQSQGQGGQQGADQIGLEAAKEKALADAGVSASAVTYTKTKLDHEDGVLVYDLEFYTATHKYEYEIHASTGAVMSRNVEMFRNGSGSGSGNAGSYIGIDKAKSIAVEHAGFSVSNVIFSKAKLENDDGYIVYEVEFYKDGMEYEYTIDALNGDILEFDSERDD